MKKLLMMPYGIAILACFVGAFYDYEISVALSGMMPYVAVFFEKVCIFPIQCVVAFTLVLLYRAKLQKGYLLLADVTCIYIVIDTVARWYYQPTPFYFITMVLIAQILLILLFQIMQQIPNHKMHDILTFFLYVSAVLVTSIIITTVIKTFWGRVRFRDLQQISDFSAWYIPKGINGHHSFPSGHVTSMTCILCFIHWRKNPYQHIRIWRYILIITLIVFMVLSRIAIGAHYLSDTAIGFTIAYSCFLYFTHWFKRRNYL